MEKKGLLSLSSRKGLTLALTSGVLAALAGTFGKLAMTESDTLWICESISAAFDMGRKESVALCSQGLLTLRIVAFALMILFNAIMWTTFVKALRFCNTSLEATVTNTAANFFTSAVVGRLLFEESMTLMWWVGTLLILFGLGLMAYTDNGGSIRTGVLSSSSSSRKKHR